MTTRTRNNANPSTNTNAAADATTTTTVTKSTSKSAVEDHHHLWPFWYILGGLAVGFGWLWGNTVQIQTSEAWILQLKTGIDLAPHFAILLQVADFFNGNLTQSQVIADTWGWGNQFIILICSIGVEFPAHTPTAKRRASWFGWGCAPLYYPQLVSPILPTVRSVGSGSSWPLPGCA